MFLCAPNSTSNNYQLQIAFSLYDFAIFHSFTMIFVLTCWKWKTILQYQKHVFIMYLACWHVTAFCLFYGPDDNIPLVRNCRGYTASQALFHKLPCWNTTLKNNVLQISETKLKNLRFGGFHFSSVGPTRTLDVFLLLLTSFIGLDVLWVSYCSLCFSTCSTTENSVIITVQTYRWSCLD